MTSDTTWHGLASSAMVFFAWDLYHYCTSGGTLKIVTFDRCLRGELVAARRANAPHTFNRWLSGGGIHDLEEPVVKELLLDWLTPLLTEDERDRLVAWLLGVSL